MMGKMNVAALLGAVAYLAGTAGAQTCFGGIAGIQSTSVDVCCVAACGTCGGPGCTPSNTSGLTSGDCCTTEIVASGVLCADTNAAPCILATEPAPSTSTCDNGQTGVQDPDTDVCCPLECGTSCGGAGCGTIPGVPASQCCASAIIASGVTCGNGQEPPCVQTAVAAENATCSDGTPGIEGDRRACCDPGCSVCGGATCGNQIGLTSADCCVSAIVTANELCSVKGSAPCLVDPPAVTPSTCPNGLPGVADGNVCCAEACNGQCGGAGCGAIPGTGGASDCCSATILASGVMCGDAAPCIMANGTFTPAPAVVMSMAPTPVGQTSAPTPGSRAIDFTGVPTPVPTDMEDAASVAPTAGDRGVDIPTAGPSAAPTLFPPGATLPPGVTLPPSSERSGSATLPTGSVVTLAAMAAGVFAVMAAARN